MKNLLVFYDENQNFKTQLEDVPVPYSDLKPHDVLIKVNVAGSNPKDYKHPLPAYFNNKLNQGDDCAGTIAAVGSAVKVFKVGERVAGFHQMDSPNGTYAEFAICPEQTVFRIPDPMSDEEAATLPLAIFTAAVGLYSNLGLPAPWDRSDDEAASTEKIPLVVNAASSAVGAFAIKLAKLNARISPIIATAGSSKGFVKTLGADAIVDYRSSSVAEEIKEAASGVPIRNVFDAANSVASVKYLSDVLEKGGRYCCTQPLGANSAYGQDNSMERMLKAADVWFEQIWVGDVHGMKKLFAPAERQRPNGIIFGGIMSRVIETAAADGRLTGHPYQLVEGGLEGIQAALEELRDRKYSGNVKFVTRIGGTPGLQAG